VLARVSNLDAFRRWREDDEQTVGDLVHWLTTDCPSEPMLAGTAFHKALEGCPQGEFETLQANGYTFLMPDAQIALPAIRELRSASRYGQLVVTGCVDCLEGKRIEDHKTTSRFDPERYLAGYQWRFYLDIFNADVFRWNVFEIRETDHKAYKVGEPQTLETYRYPNLHDDCMALAADYYEFARIYLQQAA
jgi:hypothetical protein